jgi:DoxX-like family
MNVALWIVASVLAFVLLLASAKMVVPQEKMVGMMGSASRWVEDFEPRALKAIGLLELLGAIGLILPGVLGVAPVLVPVTGVCVVLLFVGAVSMRLRRGERITVVGDLIYLAMAVFVTWGRIWPSPL